MKASFQAPALIVTLISVVGLGGATQDDGAKLLTRPANSYQTERPASTGREGQVPHPGATQVFGDAELIELGRWAVARFAGAGLTLPAVQVHFHAENGACGGHRGTFNPVWRRIDVCEAEPMVILHELAHAWASEALTETDRDHYVASMGFESWNDPASTWSRRASEGAANIIAWGLLEHPLATSTPDGPIAENHAAYRLLTGRDSPRFSVDEPASCVPSSPRALRFRRPPGEPLLRRSPECQSLPRWPRLPHARLR